MPTLGEHPTAEPQPTLELSNIALYFLQNFCSLSIQIKEMLQNEANFSHLIILLLFGKHDLAYRVKTM